MKNLLKGAIVFFAGISILFLSGCATYRFQHGNPPYDKGYVALRDDHSILEYTLGKDNSVPGIKLAKERFKRRKRIVEDYYKRMGIIQNHFTMAVWEPSISFVKLIGGIFRLPFIAISDYRYDHNPKYKELVKKREAEQDLREAQRIKKLKDKLYAYVEKDLEKEPPIAQQKTEAEPVAQSEKTVLAKQEEAAAVSTQKPQEVTNKPEQEAPKETPLSKKEAIGPTQASQEAVVETKPVEQQAPPEQKAVKLEQERALSVGSPAETPATIEQEHPKETPKVEEAVESVGVKQELVENKEAKSIEQMASEQKAVESEQVQTPAVTAPAEEEKAPVKVQTLPQEGQVKPVITAKPLKGYSPLRVQFDGRRSSSIHGKIISYLWDFGDGETSTKPAPVNTYWSTTYGSRYFTAVLTVKDIKGNTGTSSQTIEVLTK